jgi:uncharacterized protein YprB with RNaseH-like and TPR domain
LISPVLLPHLIGKRFTSIEPEIGIRRMATINDNDRLQNVGLYLSKYKEKWKRSVMKYEEKQIKKLGSRKDER